jgi:PAS domain S-box-containing protein
MNDEGKTEAQLCGELAAARQRIAELEMALGLRSPPTAGLAAQSPPTLAAAFSQALANSVPGVVYLYDAQGQLLSWNRQAERVSGYRAEELAGAPMARFVPEEALPVVRQRFQAVMETGWADVEFPLILKDGRQVPYYFTGHRVEFAGAPCMIGIGIDVSERERVERRRLVRLAVPQLLAQAMSLAEAAPQVLQVIAEGLGWDLGVWWRVDAPAGVLRCLDVWQEASVRAAEFLETSRQATFGPGVGLPGRVWRTGRPAWIADVFADTNFPRSPLAQAEGVHGAFAGPILAGSEVVGVIEFFSRDVREPDADLLEMMVTVGSQVGQFLRRKEAEDELRRSEARKGAMLAAALDAIITIDHEEHILEFNPAAEKIFGHPRPAALGRKLSDLIIPPPYREAHRRGLRQYLATGVGPFLGRRVEMTALRADGSEFPAEISIASTVLDGRPIFTGYLRDITERKRREEALRESEARFRAIFEQAPLAMIIYAPDGRRLRANAAFNQLLGFPCEGLAKLKTNVLEDPQLIAQGVMPFFRRAFAGEPTRIPAILFSPKHSFPGASKEDIWISGIVAPIKDEAGTIVGVVAMAEDVTDRKRAEQEVLQLNRQLEDRVVQRTAELNAANAELARAAQLKDEFFATISHELRTPLGGVLGMVDLLADTPLNEEQRHYAQVARTSADLLRDVINDILDFSRIEAGRLQLERVDFNPAEVVHEVISVLALQATAKGLDLNCRLDPGVDAWASADRGRLRQVLLNLVANAVKFTKRGEVVVTAHLEWSGGRTPLDQHQGPARGPAASDSLPPSDYCLLHCAVRDTGIGIPRDRLDRLFQPFSQVDASTSRRFGGSGLGLAISRRLTQLMRGTIGVESTPGQGSTFWFTVPLRPPQGPRPPADGGGRQAPGTAAPSRPLRILLAEDNEANQLVATALLERAGHSVRVVRDGRQAIDAHAEEQFDLILMDVQMPKVNGLEATRQIRQREMGRGTHTPIVAVTAHVCKGDQDRFLACDMDAFLTKPLERRELAVLLEALFPAEQSRAPLPPAPPAQGGGDGINWAAVLARLEGNEALLADVIDLYVSEWPRLFAELRQALDGGELGVVAFKAHRLNGLTRNFGFGPAAATAATVEALANQGEGEAIRRAGDQLLSACKLLECEVAERRRTLEISADRIRV